MNTPKATIADSFLHNCYLFPENNALFINNIHYTYSQLLQRVFAIYSQISEQEKLAERIGVYCTDDINTYASILAISLYGAAFVPLNSHFPEARNKAIIDLANLSLVVNSKDITFKNELEHVTFITFNEEQCASPTFIDKNKLQRKVTQDLAYILFTSGSTGQPKGVPVSTKNVLSFFAFYLDKSMFHFSEKDRFIQVFELTFDVSVFSFFMPLSIGACCYVSPQKGIRFLEIVKIMRDHQITVSTIVPTVLQYIEKYIEEIDFPQLKYSFFIGDKLSHSIVSKWAKKIVNAQIFNFYGPTETTIMCTSYSWNEAISLKESNNDVVPIGKPFPNMEYVLIDDRNEIIENDEIGELCFLGNQVIDSYLNNENEGRFIQLKNKKGEFKRFYKTGDLASLNSQGNLLFHGRIDLQVKINGHRVELNEIEENIRKLTSDVFYIGCFKDKKQVNQLVLFLEKNEDNIDFKTELSKSLPDYMIPKSIVILERIPFNFNNKVDVKRLEEIFLGDC